MAYTEILKKKDLLSFAHAHRQDCLYLVYAVRG